MIKVFMADDEELAQKRLLKMLAAESDFEVVGTAVTGEEAARKIEDLKPDVVFLDIDMPEKSGIELALELSEQKHSPIVVFVTAHNEFAIKAFEAHAIDYVLKPFDQERLAKTFERIREEVLHRPSQEKLATFGKDFAARSKKIVGRKPNSKDRMLIDPKEVLYFQAHLAQIHARLADKEWIVSLNLEELEEVLDPSQFARSHRAYIVNLGRVEKVVPMFNESYELILSDSAHTHIPLARRNAKEFKQKLSNW